MEGTLAAAAEQFRARTRREATDADKAAESRELAKFVAALGGKRGGAEPERPGQRSAGRPGEPEVTGRSGPRGASEGPLSSGTRGGKPDLTGRSGRAPGRPAPATGPEPALGGRRGGTGAGVPGQRSRRSNQEPEDWEYGDGDEELWLTESTAVGEIETPTEHRPQQQGRALGQG